MLETALEALKKFDWGSDLSALNPIEDAIVAGHGKPELCRDLEQRLLAALKGGLSRDAQDYVCRKLATIGSASCVSLLAELLLKPDHAHMARFALERIPAPEAGEALTEALNKVSGPAKVGVASSLGGRRETAAVPALAKCLRDTDPAVARAAILALGAIGGAASAAALREVLNTAKGKQNTVVDALFSCAESLLAGNQRSEAHSIYQALNQAAQPRIVRLAATRGLLACADRSAS